MSNYAKILPRDAGGEPLQEFPTPYVALTRTNKENASASSVFGLSHNTTVVEVAAIGGPAAIKWIATSDTTASVYTSSTIAGAAGAQINFDNIIGTGTVRRFVVPKESSNVAANSVVGVNRREGLYQRIAVKSASDTTSSVLTTEY